VAHLFFFFLLRPFLIPLSPGLLSVVPLVNATTDYPMGISDDQRVVVDATASFSEWAAMFLDRSFELVIFSPLNPLSSFLLHHCCSFPHSFRFFSFFFFFAVAT
jgi:hypothetical protein